MATIINTFIEKRAAQLSEEFDGQFGQGDDADLFEQSVELGRMAVDVVEDTLEEFGVDFDYKTNPELKGDMFVILNLMVSALLRDAGLEHVLHEEMDLLKDRIMELEKFTDDIT
ncbi:MAG: hypothetical protein QNK64_10150 [Saprospiraceae bacterium]